MAAPAGVLLPTVEWSPACDEVAAQLGPDDELFVACDSPDDPVADRADDLPERTDLVFAGEPEGCSGKANAIAAHGIVWTDVDFHHPPKWLDTLHVDYERHGPVSEPTFFVGRDPLSTLLEPVCALGGTLGVYAHVRRTFIWGGRYYRCAGSSTWR